MLPGAGRQNKRQIVYGAGPHEFKVADVRCARAAQKKTSELNQQDESGGVPHNRRAHRATGHVTLDPAIAKITAASQFFGSARTGQQRAQTFADAAAVRLPGDAETRLSYNGAARRLRVRQNRDESNWHVWSIIPAHGNCARQLWETA